MPQGQGILAIDMSLTQHTSLPQPSETSKPLLPRSSPSTRLVRSEHQHKKRPKQMLTSTIPKLLMTCVKTMKTKRPIGFNLPSLSWAAHALPLDQNDILNSEVGNLGPFGSEGGTWERKEKRAYKQVVSFPHTQKHFSQEILKVTGNLNRYCAKCTVS